MTVTELVAILGVLVAIASGITVPIYLDRRKTRVAQEKAEAELGAAQAEADVLSWEKITAVIQSERNAAVSRLQEVEAQYDEKFRLVEVEYAKKFDRLEAEYTEKFRLLEEDCNRRVDAANQRIRELEAEVTDLYREIHGQSRR